MDARHALEGLPSPLTKHRATGQKDGKRGFGFLTIRRVAAAVFSSAPCPERSGTYVPARPDSCNRMRSRPISGSPTRFTRGGVLRDSGDALTVSRLSGGPQTAPTSAGGGTAAAALTSPALCTSAAVSPETVQTARVARTVDGG